MKLKLKHHITGVACETLLQSAGRLNEEFFGGRIPLDGIAIRLASFQELNERELSEWDSVILEIRGEIGWDRCGLSLQIDEADLIKRGYAHLVNRRPMETCYGAANGVVVASSVVFKTILVGDFLPPPATRRVLLHELTHVMDLSSSLLLPLHDGHGPSFRRILWSLYERGEVWAGAEAVYFDSLWNKNGWNAPKQRIDYLKMLLRGTSEKLGKKRRRR